FQLLTSFSIAMTNEAATKYGGSALAAMGPVTKMMSIGSLAVFGFLKGFQPIAGFNYGSGNYKRLREAIRTAVIWSTIFCVGFGLTVAVFSEKLMSQFTKNDLEMVRIGQMALRANGISFMTFGFHTVFCFLFLVMGKAKEGCILGACRQGTCFLPAIWFLPKVLGLRGVLYAQPVADVLAAVVTVFMAWKFYRNLIPADKR
ncbi:MAG: MATE family efflux transporter, partial [Lachnospiraceae bacterium]|nr:MATE family efflux transporter [Lachnospiraceae bacterium]